MALSDILDQYVTGIPDDPKALDLFRDEWSSALPSAYAGLKAGHAALFEDPRLTWGLERIGGVDGRRVLELGPLEGGHSYMLAQAGADSVIAIEANTRAFLKCLIIKEIVGIPRCRFKLGDFMEYLRADPPQVDVAVASGVLYHMREPLELLGLLARVTDRVFLWTHYFDPGIIRANPNLSPKFVAAERHEYGGFRCTAQRQLYQAALDWKGFCGGSAAHSFWLERDDIIGALRHFGYTRIDVGCEQPDHPNGPAFCLAAQR